MLPPRMAPKQLVIVPIPKATMTPENHKVLRALFVFVWYITWGPRVCDYSACLVRMMGGCVCQVQSRLGMAMLAAHLLIQPSLHSYAHSRDPHERYHR